ncbi:MAG: hypothetical protein JWP88_650 [Flaviaesturariibacter sp.]|nr:hypothetical protein [Flaviaesturariibacter sp.]
MNSPYGLMERFSQSLYPTNKSCTRLAIYLGKELYATDQAAGSAKIVGE